MRRKKVAVRAGQLALASMILLGLAGAAATNIHRLPAGRIFAFVGAGVVYLLWSLYGMRDAVQFLLLDRWTETPSSWVPGRRWKVAGYFSLQLTLAILILALGGEGYGSGLLWLALLAPVAHSVILLPRFGVAIVSSLTMAIFVLDIFWWFGWRDVPNAALQFFFAVIFTVVFTSLAVSSEKARGEVQRLAGELSDANGKLREYAVQAGELAATRERNNLAREIHDTLGHYLTALNMQLEAGSALLPDDPPRARSALEKAQGLAREGLREIRRSVSSLRASPLDHQSLADALRRVIEESAASGVRTELQLLGEVRALSTQAELTLYRAGQEGLTNVRKHAQATSAQLVLDYRKAGRVALSLVDNGVGTGASTPDGFGLLGLRERALLLGGSVRIRTSPGKGFALEVEVPG